MTYTFNFMPVFQAWDRLLEGLVATLRLSISAMLIGGLLALICAIAKTVGSRKIKFFINVYVETIRNTPFLVQLFFIYFALPFIGLKFTPDEAALLALVINVGAYATEIIRAGIESIQPGQIEAGTALGLSRSQIIRFIVLRPAFRTIYPALTSQFIYLLLTTSVVSTVSALDLTSVANDIQSESFVSFEVYVVVSLIYLALSLMFSAAFTLGHQYLFRYPLAR